MSITSAPEIGEVVTVKKLLTGNLPKEIQFMNESGEVESVDSLDDLNDAPALPEAAIQHRLSKSYENVENSIAPPVPSLPDKPKPKEAIEPAEDFKITMPPISVAKTANSQPPNRVPLLDSATAPTSTNFQKLSRVKEGRKSIVENFKHAATTAQFHPKGSLASLFSDDGDLKMDSMQSVTLRSIGENGISPMSWLHAISQLVISTLYISELFHYLHMIVYWSIGR
ncbi:UNVERIFIED_CONTAM: hypothetical protein HDU68_005798 [Siphonaria sp. JEL0065]|nr:hypothetical protein HDU68_005798 [Siphonaria sp. JEL0065]